MPGKRTHRSTAEQKSEETNTEDAENGEEGEGKGLFFPDMKKVKDAKKAREKEKAMAKKGPVKEEKPPEPTPALAPTPEPEEPAPERRTTRKLPSLVIPDLSNKDLRIIGFMGKYLADYSLITTNHPILVTKFALNYLFQQIKKEIEATAEETEV